MLVIIVGPSGSGKTTISNALRDTYGFKEFISYTTREKREREVDGIDYHFIDNARFQSMIRKGQFAEYEMYSGARFYGTALEDVIQATNDANNNYCMVLTPGGMRSLLHKIDREKTLTVLVDAPLVDRVTRYISRCKDFTMGDLDELHARANRDDGMFRGVEKEVDLVLTNDSSKNIGVLARQILNVTKEREERDER